MNEEKKDQPIRIDFRDSLGTPFQLKAREFLEFARKELIKTRRETGHSGLGEEITDVYLGLVGVKDLVDQGNMLSVDEMHELTDLSKDEIILLEAIAYANVLGLDTSELERLATGYGIYSDNYPIKPDDTFPSFE